MPRDPKGVEHPARPAPERGTAALDGRAVLRAHRLHDVAGDIVALAARDCLDERAATGRREVGQKGRDVARGSLREIRVA